MKKYFLYFILLNLILLHEKWNTNRNDVLPSIKPKLEQKLWGGALSIPFVYLLIRLLKKITKFPTIPVMYK